jgi:putative endonuclease
MASHNDFGKVGEEWAVSWLVNHGYSILHRNWRHSYYEIDIVALKKDRLHIIEVKTRKGTFLGNPEQGVKRKKFKDLQRATDEFLFQNPGYKWLQYDILAITLIEGKEPAFFLLEDVYLW